MRCRQSRHADDCEGHADAERNESARKREQGPSDESKVVIDCSDVAEEAGDKNDEDMMEMQGIYGSLLQLSTHMLTRKKDVIAVVAETPMSRSVLEAAI